MNRLSNHTLLRANDNVKRGVPPQHPIERISDERIKAALNTAAKQIRRKLPNQ